MRPAVHMTIKRLSIVVDDGLGVLFCGVGDPLSSKKMGVGRSQICSTTFLHLEEDVPYASCIPPYF